MKCWATSLFNLKKQKQTQFLGPTPRDSDFIGLGWAWAALLEALQVTDSQP